MSIDKRLICRDFTYSQNHLSEGGWEVKTPLNSVSAKWLLQDLQGLKWETNTRKIQRF